MTGELYKSELIIALENAKKYYSEINSNLTKNLTQEIINNVESTFREEIPGQINNIVSLINRCDSVFQYQFVLSIEEAYKLVAIPTFEDAIDLVNLNTDIKGVSPLKNITIGTQEILREILNHVKTSVQSLRITLSLAKM